jgi:hypothetical protein
MTVIDKDKVPWFQQYGPHIDSMPVENNSPAPDGTRLALIERAKTERSVDIEEFLKNMRSTK